MDKKFTAVLAPELAYGGYFDAEKSWFGTDWEYPSMQDIVGDGRILNVLGLMNDRVGYIVPDNNHIPMLADESGGIEFVSPGSSAA